MTKPLSEAARQALLGVSTATLTTQLFKRGLRNVFDAPRLAACTAG